MTITSKRAWAVGVICVTTACSDLPLLPQWDANWNVPLPTQALTLPPAIIPAGLTAPIPPTTQQEPLDKSIGDLLSNAADTGSVLLTLIKKPSLAVNGTVTAEIDSTAAFGASKITIPVTFTAASDTTHAPASAVNVGMIRATADAGRTLYIRLSGSASNPGPGSVTVTSANDTIYVKLNVLSTIHVSR
jgi:hypothetical protein